jgi:hypothetical protein
MPGTVSRDVDEKSSHRTGATVLSLPLISPAGRIPVCPFVNLQFSFLQSSIATYVLNLNCYLCPDWSITAPWPLTTDH